MSGSARVWLVLAAVLVAGIVAVSWRPREASPALSRSPVAGENGPSAAQTEPPGVGGRPAEKLPAPIPPGAVAPDTDTDPPAAPPAGGTVPDGGPAANRLANTPPDTQNTRRVMDDLQFVFRDYRTAVGGNPVGTNAEITGALLGDNIGQVKVALPVGATVNGRGEMCDLWGTPYFFHQLSGTRMEIRSAGPDRRLWTADDVAR